MSSRRVQNLDVIESNVSNSQCAENKLWHATGDIGSSRYVGNTSVRKKVEHGAVSFTCPPPLTSLTRYVSDESQDHNSALPSFPLRKSRPLVRYVSDETQHNDFPSPEKEQNDFAITPKTNNCTEDIPRVVNMIEENEHPNRQNSVGCVISSERIDMFVNEANVQSQDEKLNYPQHIAPPDNQELVSLLTLLEQHMDISSNDPNEPVPLREIPEFDAVAPLNAYSCVAMKVPVETCSEKRTSIIGDNDVVPDSTASHTSASHNSKPSNTSIPIRPLNAYNYFFADERERIISGNDNDVCDDDKKQRLLLQHLMKDRSARRKHRKTHGKINFTTLSRIISQRWKTLPEDKKKFYKDISAADWARYRQKTSERTEQKIYA